VLHNHATIDPVLEVLPFGSPGFNRVVGLLRRELLDAAAGEGIDLIYTFVYAPVIDDERVADAAGAFERAGGTVTFVRLTASRDELLRRVLDEKRQRHGKIVDTATLTQLLDEYDLTAEVPGRESLTIDLDGMSAADAADQIVAHLAVS
jgi:hypothetical protein